MLCDFSDDINFSSSAHALCSVGEVDFRDEMTFVALTSITCRPTKRLVAPRIGKAAL